MVGLIDKIDGMSVSSVEDHPLNESDERILCHL